ncbi:MAG TPA: ribonuclease HII [Deltaproteobacteria bacterium]|nr:ribonuclease HII [Deltaproteobacteria bacterium]
MNTFEKVANLEGYSYVAGIDEAGRGPLAGPVVAAAVIFPPNYKNPAINDSKKLSCRKREILYNIIYIDAIAIGVGVIDSEIIDKVNILQATFIAMREAVRDLSFYPDYLLIDGLHRLQVEIPQKPLVKGDALSVSIAGASIIAKVARDRIMEMYHRQYPHYNFQRNKGYGTKEHCRAIEEFGICKIHRKSFTVKNKPMPQLSLDLFKINERKN